MASLPQQRISGSDDPRPLVESERLPGHTVDALLKLGKTEEAQEELERLALEGLNSGEPITMTPKHWEELRRDLHAEISARS